MSHFTKEETKTLLQLLWVARNHYAADAKNVASVYPAERQLELAKKAEEFHGWIEEAEGLVLVEAGEQVTVRS